MRHGLLLYHCWNRKGLLLPIGMFPNTDEVLKGMLAYLFVGETYLSIVVVPM